MGYTPIKSKRKDGLRFFDDIGGRGTTLVDGDIYKMRQPNGSIAHFDPDELERELSRVPDCNCYWCKCRRYPTDAAADAKGRDGAAQGVEFIVNG
ncbi:hypothetical protein Hz2V055 [Helicoverpa zea nudivirus 2]|uniref:Uncharacterized protein n=1 Tax=Helicoverpa zea nudivirus 2 TaxID=1128424 RepID=G9I081_HZNV2|nr:orf55 gene product [Helicoverpa zea nudivirus 2]AEW69604.1 hypothetical protein Hz2V055 [Helicoverpa zea nudivirus 2]